MSYPPPGQPTYPAAPPPGSKPKLRGRIPFRLSVIFGVLGVAAIALGVILFLNSASVSSFKRVPLDGQGHQVKLTRTGDYVAYYEGSNVAGNGATPTFRLRIVAPSGQDIDVRKYSQSSTVTYNTDGHHGSAAGKFTITKVGTYTVGGDGSGLAADADIALGESIAKTLVGGVLSVVGGILLVIVAVVLLVVGIFRRRGHRQQLAAYGY